MVLVFVSSVIGMAELTPEQKAEQWRRIQRDHPDMAEFVREVVRVFGKLEGIYKPTTGWVQPQIEAKHD